jgi:hypothetical protein
MARVAGMAGAITGISILGSGLAMADTTAFVAGGGARAHYDSSSNVLTVFDSACDGAPVAGIWKWDSSPTQRAIIDNICEDGTPARRTLDPPAAATNVRIQACKVRSDGVLFSCGAWQTTHK